MRIPWYKMLKLAPAAGNSQLGDLKGDSGTLPSFVLRLVLEQPIWLVVPAFVAGHYHVFWDYWSSVRFTRERFGTGSRFLSSYSRSSVQT